MSSFGSGGGGSGLGGSGVSGAGGGGMETVNSTNMSFSLGFFAAQALKIQGNASISTKAAPCNARLNLRLWRRMERGFISRGM